MKTPKVKAAIVDGALVITIPVMVKLEDVPADGTLFSLTPRERQVMNELEKGMQNKEIADKLNLSASTVKFHVASLLKKYDVSSRVDLIGARERLSASLE